MKVVTAPDIIDLNDWSSGSKCLEYGNISLRCKATGNPKPEITWRREDTNNILQRNEYGLVTGKTFYPFYFFNLINFWIISCVINYIIYNTFIFSFKIFKR